jgi:two-component system LytT family response regulator
MRGEPRRAGVAWIDDAVHAVAAPHASALVEAPDREGSQSGAGTGAVYAQRIAVRSVNRIVIVPVDDIVRLEAEDNYVRIFAGRTHLHKETLTRLCTRLDPAQFLRIHRSHAISLRVLRELVPQPHGEFRFVLDDGTELRSGRSYRARIEAALGLA